MFIFSQFNFPDPKPRVSKGDWSVPGEAGGWEQLSLRSVWRKRLGRVPQTRPRSPSARKGRRSLRAGTASTDLSYLYPPIAPQFLHLKARFAFVTRISKVSSVFRRRSCRGLLASVSNLPRRPRSREICLGRRPFSLRSSRSGACGALRSRLAAAGARQGCLPLAPPTPAATPHSPRPHCPTASWPRRCAQDPC